MRLLSNQTNGSWRHYFLIVITQQKNSKIVQKKVDCGCLRCHFTATTDQCQYWKLVCGIEHNIYSERRKCDCITILWTTDQKCVVNVESVVNDFLFGTVLQHRFSILDYKERRKIVKCKLEFTQTQRATTTNKANGIKQNNYMKITTDSSIKCK